jgi:MFS family permease
MTKVKKQLLRTSSVIHPAWFVAGLTFLTLMATAGFRSAPSVLIVPLEEAFGWRRDGISLAISINVLLYGLTAPFAAALMERFGIKKVVMAALTAVGVGDLLTLGLCRGNWDWLNGAGLCCIDR